MKEKRMFCIQCGAENEDNATNCFACRAPLAQERAGKKPFDSYTANINEKLNRLHGINQRFYLNEAEETKKRIRTKLIVSAVIGISVPAFFLIAMFNALAANPESLSTSQSSTSSNGTLTFMIVAEILVVAFLPLGISFATEFIRDHPEYKNAAIALIVISCLGLGMVTIPALAIAGIPGIFYLKNKRQKAIEEIKQYGSN